MTPRAPWREPMVWLVFALPAAVLAAAAWTIATAAGGTDVARADVRRTAQIQTEDIAADIAAARRALHGDVRVDGHDIVVRLAGDVDDEAVQLSLQHPVDAARDRVLTLRRDGDGWRATADGVVAPHAWHVAVTGDDGRWRLHGRLAARATRASLQPSVAR